MGAALLKTLFPGVWIFVLFCAMIGAPMALLGQELSLEDDGLKFLYNRKRARIPFTLVHNLIIIPIKINNSSPLNFVVDTGVDRTLLLEIGQFDTITLNNVEKLFLRGLGSGEGIKAMLSSGNSINFSGVESKNQKVLLLEQNIFNLSSRVGMEVHGIIGYPLFKDFVVEIDYESKVMTLYKPGTYPRKKALKSSVIPLEIEASKPYVQVQANFPDGKKHSLRLVVDSGMSTSMLLYPPTIPEVKIPDKRIEAYLGRGLNGDIHGEIARLETIEIGQFTLKKPPACFPDSISIRHALGLNNRNGNLGADVLQRFKVVFDYANSRMLLQPSRKYKMPFYYNLSGLELLSPIPGFNFYTIAQVMPNSPAQRAGLEPGDAILSINGVECIDQTLGEILEMFQNHPKRRLQLKVSRELKSFHTTIHLQDLI